MIRRDALDIETVEIREATLVDLDRVTAIERAASHSPWPRHIFRDELIRGWSRLLLLTPARAGAPVAFLNYWVDADEVQILNVATHPLHRRQGYARRLLHRMLELAPQEGGRFYSLEVRRSNGRAIALYESLGFRSIGVRPGYYASSGEDALVMVLRGSDLRGRRAE